MLLLLPVSIWRVRRHRLLDGWIAIAWAAPMLFVFLAVHFGKPGYLVPLVPLFCLYLVRGVGEFGAAGTALLSAVAIANVVQFMWFAPISAAVTRENKRYADKTIAEKLTADLSPVAFASLASLGLEDARVTTVTARVSERCPQGGVIMVGAGGPLDWRRAMFYLPLHTVMLFDKPAGPLMAARQRAVRVMTMSETVASACAPLWIDNAPPEVPGAAVIADDRLPGLWVLEGDVRIPFAGEALLTVAR